MVQMLVDYLVFLSVALKVVSKVDSLAVLMVDWLVVRMVGLMVVAKVANWESSKAEMMAD